eukprot:10287505-Ditylum_brightwellii.AAC.1
MGKEKGEESKDNVGGDNAESELHKRTAKKRPTVVKNLEVTSNHHVEGGKQIAKIGVAKGS